MNVGRKHEKNVTKSEKTKASVIARFKSGVIYVAAQRKQTIDEGGSYPGRPVNLVAASDEIVFEGAPAFFHQRLDFMGFDEEDEDKRLDFPSSGAGAGAGAGGEEDEQDNGRSARKVRRVRVDAALKGVHSLIRMTSLPQGKPATSKREVHIPATLPPPLPVGSRHVTTKKAELTRSKKAAEKLGEELEPLPLPSRVSVGPRDATTKEAELARLEKLKEELEEKLEEELAELKKAAQTWDSQEAQEQEAKYAKLVVDFETEFTENGLSDWAHYQFAEDCLAVAKEAVERCKEPKK